MRFSEYFGAWIRAYYANIPLGRDFYTAVNASRFFGGAIAKYILDLLESSAVSLPLNIIDLGANSANLLNDIRAFLGVLGLGVVKQCNFIAVEANAPESSLQGGLTPKQSTLAPSLRDSQRKSKQSAPTPSLRDLPKANRGNPNNIFFYKNLADLKATNIYANCHNVFIANEFFDALPCEIIIENKMAFVENSRIIFKPCNDKKLLEICEKFKIHKGEIPLIYDEICASLANLDTKFIFIAFDYGDENPRNELTTRFFYHHKVQNLNDFLVDSALDSSKNSTNQTQDSPNHSANLFSLFGKCDITYNVPFFLLDSAFERIDSKKILSKQQDLALVENFKILDLLQDFYESQNGANRTYLSESNKIKTLLCNLSPKFHARIYKNF